MLSSHLLEGTTNQIAEISAVDFHAIFPTGEFDSIEPPLDNDKHRRQIDLLIRLLEYYWRDRNDFYVSGNLTIFYSATQKKSTEFRGPDFFVVLDTEKRDRRSWVVWQEGGKYPNLIIELLSESTADVDRGGKKQIYQDIFRTPEYFWLDTETMEFQGFRIVSGKYQPIAPHSQGWLWSEELQLYLGIHNGKLRFFSPDFQLIPLPEEELEKASQELNALKDYVRSLGIDPTQILNP
jgi:Uma2 family endonuclease